MRKFSLSHHSFHLRSAALIIAVSLIAVVSAQGMNNVNQEKSTTKEEILKPVFRDIIFVRAYAVDPSKGEQAPITYTLTEPALMRIIVCAPNDPDQLYRILLWEWQEAGPHTVMFDGKDQNGYPLDMKKCAFWASAYEKDRYKPGTIELKPLTTQDLILGKQGPHNHLFCFKDKCKPSQVRFAGFQNVLPNPSDDIFPIKKDVVLSGVVNIKAHVAKDARGYGDITGYGVRWMVDQTLISAQYYERDCDGEFEFQLDTSAFPEGSHILRVSCCDHYDHIGVFSMRVNFRETR